MESINLSPVNQAIIQKQQNTANNSQTQTPSPEMKKNSNKKLALALAALGSVAVAGIAIYKHKKNANVSEVVTKTLDDLKKLKSENKVLDGVFSGSLKNGDKVTLEYSNGILQKSVKEGRDGFEKIYKEVDGKRIIETTLADGTKKSTNITEIHEAVQKSQDDFVKLLDKNTSNLNSAEYKEMSSGIKYLNKSDKEYIQNQIASRENIEELQKAIDKNKAEVAALELKQKHANEIAKEAQERLDKEALNELQAKKAQQYYSDLAGVRDGVSVDAHKSADFFTKNGFEANYKGMDINKRIENLDLSDCMDIKPEVQKKFAELPQETLESLSDDFIKAELTYPTGKFSIEEKFDKLQQFTPEELKILTNSEHGTYYLRTIMSGNYNTQADYDSLMNAISGMIKRTAK